MFWRAVVHVCAQLLAHSSRMGRPESGKVSVMVVSLALIWAEAVRSRAHHHARHTRIACPELRKCFCNVARAIFGEGLCASARMFLRA